MSLTSNVALEAFPGNVLLPVDASGLGKDSVAVVSQVGLVSREFLEPHPVGHAPSDLVSKIADGLRLVSWESEDAESPPSGTLRIGLGSPTSSQ